MIRIILGFHRFRCPVAHGLVQPFRVPPRDPPERRQLQALQIMEGPAPPDEPGLARGVGGFGHGVVVGVADRAGRRQHAIFHHPGGVHRAGVLHAMIAVADETVGPAMRRGPGDRLLQRLQGQLLRVHGRGARPAHDPPGEHVGDECGIREAPVGHAHVGDVGHVQPVRRLGLELAVHQVGPAARALRGLGGDGRLSTPDALYAEPAHDVHHLVAAHFPGIPALADELMPHLAVSVYGGELADMDAHDVAGQRLMARPHAADGP